MHRGIGVSSRVGIESRRIVAPLFKVSTCLRCVLHPTFFSMDVPRSAAILMCSLGYGHLFGALWLRRSITVNITLTTKPHGISHHGKVPFCVVVGECEPSDGGTVFVAGNRGAEPSQLHGGQAVAVTARPTKPTDGSTTGCSMPRNAVSASTRSSTTTHRNTSFWNTLVLSTLGGTTAVIAGVYIAAVSRAALPYPGRRM
jgi:hypothetical protein